VELDFGPPAGKGSGFLNAGEGVRFTIAGLSAAAFAAATAHIQRIGFNGEEGAHVGASASVPEPVSSVTALGLGLVAIGLVRWRVRH
jgi:hypothetical protein